MKINSDKDISNFLRQSVHVEGTMLGLISEVDKTKNQVGDLTHEQQVAISAARIFSSNTLKTGTESYELWNAANLFLMECLERGSGVTVQDIVKMQNKVTGREDLIRTQAIFGSGEYISPDYLTELLSVFEKQILKASDLHPLIQGAECYIWLATLHPFPDGNGRTARLICDYFLLKNNYLPITFRSPVEAHASMVKNSIRSTKEEMVSKVITSILSTYRRLLENI